MHIVLKFDWTAGDVRLHSHPIRHCGDWCWSVTLWPICVTKYLPEIPTCRGIRCQVHGGVVQLLECHHGDNKSCLHSSLIKGGMLQC